MSNALRTLRVTPKSTPPRVDGILASTLQSCKSSATALAIGCALAGCGPETPAPPDPADRVDAPAAREAARYTGTAVCIECHTEEAAAWSGSDHDLAMQPAASGTVLGIFDGRSVELDGQGWQFEKRGDDFVVTVSGPQEPVQEHRIEYTFGVRPLQQYLVPADGGRLQPLPVAWDSRPADSGGQRWLHLYEGAGLRTGDPLHWQGRIQTWNHQCADCHSTALERGYDDTTGQYHTQWQEIDVGCESCHGPGSNHVKWAQQAGGDDAYGLIAPLRVAPGRWRFGADDSIAHRSEPARHGEVEIGTCAPCHSRRARITPNPLPGSPLLDGYLPALLDEGLYFANGRMREEVYVWGSFQQSRMHAAGVTCSDCHDPHSLAVRGGPDEVCASCHLPAVFATRDHHGHPSDSSGASCVACHMPERTYMQVDARRDHALQVPRPDVAARTGSPTVCLDCHPQRNAQWAADVLEQRGALRDVPHPGDAIAAAWNDAPGAAEALAEVLRNDTEPPIVRATAASLLGRQLDRRTLPALRAALSDESPLVRLGGVYALAALAPTDRLALGRGGLTDPVRAVRIESARTLAAVPPEAWSPPDRTALARALGEYREAQELNRDQPEAQLNLSVLESQLQNLDEALARAQRAVALAPDSAVPLINLADVQRMRGNEPGAEDTLRRGLISLPDTAALHLALGFSLVRQGRGEEALESLGQAFESDPESTRTAYAYALALNGAGRPGEAIEILARTIRNDPGNREVLIALATFERDRGRSGDAARWADALVALDPEDAQAQSLRRSLDAR